MTPTEVRLRYSLSWIAPNAPRALESAVPINVIFWRAKNTRTLNGTTYIPIPARFANGFQKTLETTITVTVPLGVAAISLALGRSGLETVKTVVP